MQEDLNLNNQEHGSDENTEPVFFDSYFRKKPKKHGREYKVIDAPEIKCAIADTHAHIDMMSNPALTLARAAVHGVNFIECMIDPLSDDGIRLVDLLDQWNSEAKQMLPEVCGGFYDAASISLPHQRISIGVHPHYAKDFTDSTLNQIEQLAVSDDRISAIGEIGLDYHYDLSPREDQKRVFACQLKLAQMLNLPVVLHIREAFDDAFAILDEVGFPQAGTLLHCYTSDDNEIQRWIDAGCYIAFGGALTFKKLDEVRQACKLVPLNRLLTETDSPFMAPEPFRGCTCEPAHTIWTAKFMCDLLGFDESEECRNQFYSQLFENALSLLDQPRVDCPIERAE